MGYVEKIDIHEALNRLKEESKKWNYTDSRMIWDDDGNDFVEREDELLETTLTKFQEEGTAPGLAVDLGCGNSFPTIRLLQKGWKVIAVDFSKGAIERLRETANKYGSNWLRDGQLTLVCQNIETYQFPKNVRLIMANNSLPFCNPAKIKQIWDRAYASLEVGGRFIGNFFPKQILPGSEYFVHLFMNVSLIDLAVVRALLEDKKYQIEMCDYGQFWKDIKFSGKRWTK